MRRAAEQWPAGSGVALATAALLLGGALGKSAQFPLQAWLPDAMAGPTPVSALIHAATMVTAGVYLIARVHVLFQLAPTVQEAVAWVGATTLLLAAFSALTQKDIKRVLAYSTISQIGYMFLALGVGAWPAAMFHFMTHAFFKALLFLGAGSVILALHHEHDMFKMGGLRRQMPLTFWTFLAGSAALAAIPLVTAGLYSKDLILSQVWSSHLGGPWLWAAGLLGAFLPAVYTFRMVFLTFFGEAKQKAARRPGGPMATALCVLAFLSLAGGFVELPRTLGNVPHFSRFIETALPAPALAHESIGAELILQAVPAVTALLGVLVAFLLFLKWPGLVTRWVATRPGVVLHRWWFAGCGFDWLYDRLFVRPYGWLARIDREDVVDSVYDAAAWSSRLGHDWLSLTQTGRVRWYAAGIALGAAALLAITVLS